MFLMLQLMPQISEGFYWFNGGIGNTFVYSLIVLSLALMIRFWRAEGAKAWWLGALLLLLMAALGGGSYSGGLFLICMMALVVLFAFVKKHRFRFVYLGLTLVLIACFAYSMAAPGNDARAAIMGTRISAPTAVIKSLYYGVTLLGNYMSLPVVAVLLFAAPLLWTMTENSKFSFKYPLLILVLGVGLFCVQLVPPMYSGVFIGGGRIQNTYYFSFIVDGVTVRTVSDRCYSEKAGEKHRLSFPRSRCSAGIAICGGVPVCTSAFLGFSRPTDNSFGPKNLTGVEAAVSHDPRGSAGVRRRDGRARTAAQRSQYCGSRMLILTLAGKHAQDLYGGFPRIRYRG